MKHLCLLLIITSFIIFSCKKDKNTNPGSNGSSDIRLVESIYYSDYEVTKTVYQYSNNKLISTINYLSYNSDTSWRKTGKSEINYSNNNIELIDYSYNQYDSSYSPIKKNNYIYYGALLSEVSEYDFFSSTWNLNATNKYQYLNNKIVSVIVSENNIKVTEDKFVYNSNLLSEVNSYAYDTQSDGMQQVGKSILNYRNNKVHDLITSYVENGTWNNDTKVGFDYTVNNQTTLHLQLWSDEINNWTGNLAQMDYLYNTMGVLIEEINGAERTIYNYESGSGNAKLFFNAPGYELLQLPSVKSQKPMNHAFMQELKLTR
jgi:hypothetical protein